MQLIDTHCHIFLEHYNRDLKETIDNAINIGVEKLFMPNVDQATLPDVLKVAKEWPEVCFPMTGLHPTSVTKDYQQQLKAVETSLSAHRFIAIGECGIDLYWDKTYYREQREALDFQLELAKRHQLPIVLHTRESFTETLDIVKNHIGPNLRGVFHCFSGNPDEGRQAIDAGFMLGIGGVVTFKNSNLGETLRKLPLSSLVAETDSPYLAPVPHRGKRNEPAFLVHVIEALAAIYKLSTEETAATLYANTRTLFDKAWR